MLRRSLPILMILAILPGRARAAEALALLPAECVLNTPEDAQRLLVQRTEGAGGELAQQVTEGIAWSSSDPHVATVVDGVVRPTGDGEARITARVGAEAATMK